MRESCGFWRKRIVGKGKANEKIHDGSMAVMFKEAELTAGGRMAAEDEFRSLQSNLKTGYFSKTKEETVQDSEQRNDSITLNAC